eukprot:TRINITY_DN27323_c0_g2_i3.p2 TRINITY_DN27323_c0_g2~~TRINITY_DN27323_c0_g2_i3.p2  ORF type:complete len:123 (-),score=2.04 TRINITY_DN27323_c0_g2_i3:250-618(-)
MPRRTKGQLPRLAKENLMRHSTSAKGDKEEPYLNRDSAVSVTLHIPGTLKDQRQSRPDKATQLPTCSKEPTGQKLGGRLWIYSRPGPRFMHRVSVVGGCLNPKDGQEFGYPDQQLRQKNIAT